MSEPTKYDPKDLPDYFCEVCGHFNAADNSSWCAHRPSEKVLETSASQAPPQIGEKTMSDVSKTETALRIIAGVRPAWAQWKMFMGNTPVPEYDKEVESFAQYQDRCSLLVRLEACHWLAEGLVCIQ